jgi:hypothetical protein
MRPTTDNREHQEKEQGSPPLMAMTISLRISGPINSSLRIATPPVGQSTCTQNNFPSNMGDVVYCDVLTVEAGIGSGAGDCGETLSPAVFANCLPLFRS